MAVSAGAMSAPIPNIMLVLVLVLGPRRFAQRSGYRRIAFRAALRSNQRMPKLTIRSETGESVSHDLVEETYTIGRSPENSIQLQDTSVSGRHAQIVVVAENCYLKDLGSTNGTVVNGQAVSEVQLRSGDRIRFGKIEAGFECDVVSAAQPLPRFAETEARPAELSARPADFANASPFPSRKTKKDPARTAVFAAVAVAFAALLAGMIALAAMKAPGF
jgi:pSer/pThr/pTyr-binding forkhead associated (FHA) protein